MQLEVKEVYRVRRMWRGRVERDYGLFELRYVAERVARAASEKHGPAGSLVMVEPTKVRR